MNEYLIKTTDGYEHVYPSELSREDDLKDALMNIDYIMLSGRSYSVGSIVSVRFNRKIWDD